MLNSLIEKHAAALKTWVNTVGPGEDLEAEGEAYDAFVGAEYAFVVHQCADPAEVQQKLSYVAQCPTLADAIQIDLHSEFMTSIRLAPAPGVAPNWRKQLKAGGAPKISIETQLPLIPRTIATRYGMRRMMLNRF
ncbi:hypothetical protein ACOJBM_29215 [Rhizobium beringeri]